MKKKFTVQYYDRLRPDPNDRSKITERKYALFPNDNAVSNSLIEGWIYEPYLFDFIYDNQLSLEGTEIIDVGANNGHFTVEFAHLVGDVGKVFSFEPQRIIFQQLCANIFLNGLDNVYPVQAAIGNQSGVIQVEKPDYSKQGEVNFGDVHVGTGASDKVENVRLLRLDDLVFQNVSIVKIDVQGFEPNVIEGATETIKKHRPYIFIEIEDEQLEKYGFKESDVIKKIENLGYVIKRFAVGIPFHTRNGICLDCVCIPKEKCEQKNYIIK